MAIKSGRTNIEIERNVIERYLMVIRDYIRLNPKKIKYISVTVLVLLVLLIAGNFYYEHVTANIRYRFDSVIDSYRENPSDPQTVEKSKNELRELIRTTSFGYVHSMSHYILASILFDEKKYAEAYDLYMAFAKKSSSDTLFIPIAINKAAVCLEEQGKYDEAISLLLKYEEDKDFKVLHDQMFYNTGCIYAVKGDKVKAKEYFMKVMSEFPESPYSERAKERLFYLSIQK